MSKDYPPSFTPSFGLSDQEAKQVKQTLDKILQNSPLAKEDRIKIFGSLAPELREELIAASKADPKKEDLLDLAQKVNKALSKKPSL